MNRSILLRLLPILLFAGFLSFKTNAQQLLINEVSQGVSTNQEYIELVVAGTRTCSDSCMDIRNWIIDDHNGWFGTSSGLGVTPGSLRFANVANWSCVPYGSIIVLYNDGAFTLADDPTDANNDNVYIVPTSSAIYMQKNPAPTSPSSSFTYPTTGWTNGGDWNYVILGNGADAIVTVDPASPGTAHFSVSYGTVNGAMVDLPNGGGGAVYYLTNGSYNSAASWSTGSAPSNETPGAANTVANATWINGMLAPGSGGAVSTNISACILQGNSYSFNNQTLTTAGTYVANLTAASGCDSTVTLKLQVITPITNQNTISGCNSVTYNGVNYTASTLLSSTVLSVLGCDSIYNQTQINVNIITAVNDHDTLASCTSIVYNGTTYTASTTIPDTIASATGCDSVYTFMHIIITPLTAVNVYDTLSGCGSVVFNGQTYNATTTVIETVTSVQGCDSLYKNHYLFVAPFAPVTVNDTLSGCSSVTYNGTVYTSPTTITNTYTSVYGCDSVYYFMHIQILTIQPAVSTVPLSGCGSVTFNGKVYTASTIVQDTLLSAQGCDSAYVVYNIQVFNTQPQIVADTISGCGAITYNGIVYAADAVISDTILSAHGCDSIYLNLFIDTNPTPGLIVGNDTTICRGESYQLTATAFGQVIWMLDGSIINNFVTPTGTNTYMAIAITDGGCTDTSYVTISIRDLNLELVVSDKTPSTGETVILTATATGGIFSVLSWEPAALFTDQHAISQRFIPMDAATYTVIAVSPEGCLDTASIYFDVNPPIENVALPTAFTPNGDHLNDEFGPIYNGLYSIVEFRVFNRWGEQLFRGGDYGKNRWDGSFKGEPVQQGVYYYILQIADLDGKTVTRKGDVLLIR